jgi:hypothetical protein
VNSTLPKFAQVTLRALRRKRYSGPIICANWSFVCKARVLNRRLLVKRFNRLKKLENLKAAVALYVAYHNFCWRPRFPGTSGVRRVTSAMAAKIEPNLWSFAELIDAVSAYEAPGAQ